VTGISRREVIGDVRPVTYPAAESKLKGARYVHCKNHQMAVDKLNK